MLGISFYPTKESTSDIKKYIDKAEKYGFNYAFTSLLGMDESLEITISKFKEVIQYARSRDFYVVLDINPGLFSDLNISYNDLTFFKELGASAIRLDSNFDGLTESIISFDKSDLDLVLNISNDTGNIQSILSYEPNRKRLTGCHNFYPQPYTGLDLKYFLNCSRKYKSMGLRTGAFVSSQVAEDGPHEYNDGLPTLEMHRKIPLDLQARHLIATGLVDDVIIGNSFASDEELRTLSEVNQDVVQLNISVNSNISSIESDLLFNKLHFNRGDINSYSIRSTFVKLDVVNESIVPNNTKDILDPGDVTIGNNDFGQYKGEVNIVKKRMKNIGHYKNVVASINPNEEFLINYITPWKKFIFSKK